MSEYNEVLKALSSDNELGKGLRRIIDGEISMPNIPLKTWGGHVFWNNIAECNGWRLQQNMFTQHARILDENDVRIAWGTVSAMTRLIDRMAKYVHDNKKMQEQESIEAAEKLKILKGLMDMGAITPKEYEQKKRELIEKI